MALIEECTGMIKRLIGDLVIDCKAIAAVYGFLVRQGNGMANLVERRVGLKQVHPNTFASMLQVVRNGDLITLTALHDKSRYRLFR